MELPVELLKEFAKATNDKKNSPNKETTEYGTVATDGTNYYVVLDGSNTRTPVSMAMDAENGDRVIVSIKNHKATVTGNLTSPASFNTSKNYMKLTEEGLVIGQLDENKKPKGMSVLIGEGGFFIRDEQGKTLSYFKPDTIALGVDELARILLCDGNGSIKLDGDVLAIEGERAVGLRSEYSAPGVNYRAESVCRADSENPQVGLQILLNGTAVSSIILSPNGVSLFGPTNSINGSEIVTSKTLMYSGLIKAKGKIKANDAKAISTEVTVPAGYYLVGIREIRSNHYHICHITQFFTNPSTNEVGVTLQNTGGNDLTDVEVTIEWFAMYSRGSETAPEQTIEWT